MKNINLLAPSREKAIILHNYYIKLETPEMP